MPTPLYRSEPRRLYRSTRDSVLMGVCGGIAEYQSMQPWVVRLLFVLFGLWGPGVIVYIIMGFAVPPSPYGDDPLPGGPYHGSPPPPPPPGASSAPGSYASSAYSPPRDDLRRTYRYSRLEALREVQRRFDRLEERLQRMESIVTDPRFTIEEEYRHL